MHRIKLHITFNDGTARTIECRSDEVVWTTVMFTIHGIPDVWMWKDIKEISVKVLNAYNA